MPPLPRSFDINGLLIGGNLIAAMAHGQSHHLLVCQAVRPYTLQTLHHIILGYGRKEQVIFIVLKVFKGSPAGFSKYAFQFADVKHCPSTKKWPAGVVTCFQRITVLLACNETWLPKSDKRIYCQFFAEYALYTSTNARIPTRVEQLYFIFRTIPFTSGILNDSSERVS
ncbi:hypothetical protein LTR67_009357 [Exophiala xenobiotica]